jgi:hypothetical protein
LWVALHLGEYLFQLCDVPAGLLYLGLDCEHILVLLGVCLFQVGDDRVIALDGFFQALFLLG